MLTDLPVSIFVHTENLNVCSHYMPKKTGAPAGKTPKKTEKEKSAVRRSTRTRAPPKRFEDEVFLPGSNNGYTAGREIDSYDKDYDGHENEME